MLDLLILLALVMPILAKPASRRFRLTQPLKQSPSKSSFIEALMVKA
jgi:hypothetical protein